MQAVGGRQAGCIAPDRRVSFAGGLFRIAPSDWEPQTGGLLREVRIGPFELDAYEVTAERWQRCVAAAGCRAIDRTEPGRPVTGLTPAAALQFCRFFGGRLPTADEWLFAAAGPNARRYPWGPTGLVCRRAVFGLADGPCAWEGDGPDIVGARPEGRTTEGVFDLSGNVAEWTLESQSKQSRGRPVFAARGGSYLSKVASDLKSWSIESTDAAAPHIGFRCAYAPD
jgi:formylglycine-generating enzyme required for sulfatase activity